MIFKREKTADDILRRPAWRRIALIVLGVYVLFNLGLAWYWSRTPDVFWVVESPGGRDTLVGFSTADTLVRVTETLLEKPGGYLTNDVMPPSVFLDNIPNWELGVLQQVRDLARVTRNDYSRSQSQSREDPDLAVAEPKIFFDHDSWIFPPTESEYREAIAGFTRYRDRLGIAGQDDAQFFARADNLREWLAQVEKRQAVNEFIKASPMAHNQWIATLSPRSFRLPPLLHPPCGEACCASDRCGSAGCSACRDSRPVR